MPMTNLKVFFESLGRTFSVEPVGPLFPDNTYWVVEEELYEWYRVSGMPTAIILINNGKAVCHGEVGVRHGRVVK